MTKKLLVIIPDRLSALLEKGEIVPRYYNPGNLFDEVHIMMTNDDKPDPKLVQPMVGDAKLILHNIEQPPHFFKNTLGWQYRLMKNWTDSVFQKVQKISPHLIRTHNNFLEGYLAAEIKHRLHVPYVTSLHGVWDEDGLSTIKERIHRFFRKKMEVKTLKNADSVICVYSPIMRYAKVHGAQNPALIHNFVGGQSISLKENWNLSNPIKLITVNRQLPEKNPTNIIKALKLLPFEVDYTLIGDGILNPHLCQLAEELGLKSKIKFFKSLPNHKVCALMQEADALVSNCHYKGISKTVIEAALAGLPIIINSYCDGYQLEEYQGGWIEECEDTPQGYANAIIKLVRDDSFREALGKKAYTVSTENFGSQHLEEKIASIYRSLT
jgi:glycosyltransferase involved in cell wall biosynthesis